MIEFQNVVMNFGDKEVLKDVSFTASRGEIFTFIGPSGSGKTTILRLTDILERPTRGRVLFDGTDVNAAGKKDRVALRRRMSMVFQKPASLRGNVYQNIAMGLQFRNIPAGDIDQRVPEALKLVGLEGYEGRKAESLSGGEMQRVALARAIATKPDVLLLDEPTANLDPVSTERIESLILSLKSLFNTTVILSTHDMIQGQRLADRIAVVIEGKIEQIGMSKEIFYHPLNRSVAHLAGVENIFDGRISSNEEGLATVMVDGIPIMAVTPLPRGTPVTLFMRPEDITFHANDGKKISARNLIHGRIRKVIPLGPMVRLRVDTGIPLVVVITLRSYDELGLSEGAEIGLAFKASAIHVVERKA